MQKEKAGGMTRQTPTALTAKLQEHFGEVTGRALAELPGRWKVDQPLHPYTSFRIGGVADALFIPASVESLQALLRIALRSGIPLFPLGNGSNLLVKDKGIRGIVILLGQAFRLLQVETGGEEAIWRVGAGVRLARLVHQAREAGLTGLEFAVGIPASVGGALKMNAGTPHGTFGDVVLSATVLESNGEKRKLTLPEMGLAYRTSSLPAGCIVIEVQLRLRRGDRHLIYQQIAALDQRRRETQPLAFPSAGCIFRNPFPWRAGQLIDGAGLKGFRIGDAQVSTQHANFIVNLGQATAREVLALIDHIKNEVYRRYRLTLEEEVQIVGEE